MTEVFWYNLRKGRDMSKVFQKVTRRQGLAQEAQLGLVCALGLLLPSCAGQDLGPKIVPSMEYSRRVHEQGAPVHGDTMYGRAGSAAALPGPRGEMLAKYYGEELVVTPPPAPLRPDSLLPASVRQQEARAGLHYVREEEGRITADQFSYPQQGNIVTNMGVPDRVSQAQGPELYVERSNDPLSRGYKRSLEFGDPGVNASLWRESKSGLNLYRDHRAFQPMDLITILVVENAEGRKEADTEVIQQSNILASISSFFNIENSIEPSNPGLETSNLINATTQNDFRGEGETERRGFLRATISAMVAEVLPSGILRIEGEKIISVNNEEQIMVISGLVRPRDITPNNEVNSQKIANIRIDYFGRGTLGEAQYGGWLSRIVRIVWPF